MKIQIDDEVRAATDEEMALLKKGEAESVARKAAAEQTATDKAALLTKLGITADEAKLLLN